MNITNTCTRVDSARLAHKYGSSFIFHICIQLIPFCVCMRADAHITNSVRSVNQKCESFPRYTFTVILGFHACVATE